MVIPMTYSRNLTVYRIVVIVSLRCVISFCLLDGTSTGNGESKGMCSTSSYNYKCLSTGYCNVCGNINNVAEGCDILSLTPVCDADSSTTYIEDSTEATVAQCVACKKDGKYLLTLAEYSRYIANILHFTISI